MRLKKKMLGIILSLVLALGLMPGMSMTVRADNTETLLTTITPTGASTYDESVAGVVTVTRTGGSFWNGYWMYSSSGSVTVEGKEGYTITKCVFSKDSDSFTDSEKPFQLTYDSIGKCEQQYQASGVGSIEVYGYATTVAVTGVSLNKTTTTLTVGDTVSFTATVEPNDATDKYVTWSSNSDALKLYADSSCTVALGTTTGVATGQPIYAKGISLGGATVTATSRSNNDVTASCDVTVISNTYNVTYKVVNGTWSDGSTVDKTETVASGGNPTSVPAGMKANSGYTGGSWDTDPSTATISADTTFTYTFVADSSSGGSSDSGSGSSSSGSSDNTNTNTDTSAKVPYDDVSISTGSVNDITGIAAATAESNPFETKIENNSDLTTLLSLTDEEVAQGVNVWLDVQDMSATVPQADKDLVQNVSTNLTVGMYLDINLFKKVGGNEATKITETNGTVKASILIPESLWKAGRTFEIIRVHDDVATAIEGTYDENTHVFTFETDKFSTYALAYKDSASLSDSGTTSDSNSSDSSNSTQSTTPKTGDPNDIRVLYLLLLASLGGLGFLGISKKKKVND